MAQNTNYSTKYESIKSEVDPTCFLVLWALCSAFPKYVYAFSNSKYLCLYPILGLTVQRKIFIFY